MLTKLSLTSWCDSRAFHSCPRFWCARERLCKNRGRSLLGMRGMLLRYSFETRPSDRVLGTADCVMNIIFSINGCPLTKFQFDERKQDWQVYDIDVTNVVLSKFRFFFVVLIKVLMAEPWFKKKGVGTRSLKYCLPENSRILNSPHRQRIGRGPYICQSC